jgi:hypothetical protein
MSLLGTSLHDKLDEAMKKIKEHLEILEEMEQSCGADQITKWKAQRDAWQLDQTAKPDPYMDGFEGTLSSLPFHLFSRLNLLIATTSTSLAQLRKEMAKEEATALSASDEVDCEAKLTASAFILQGIELEAAQ